MKFKFTLLVLSFFISHNGFAQIGRLALSPLQTLQQSLAKTDITVTYSRPAMRGRDIFGGLVPYGERWRTGANRNTKITFSEDVMIGTKLLEKGTYAIFTLPNPKNWDVYFYTDTSNWDVPEEWDSNKIAAQINVPSRQIANSVQSLTISLDDLTNEQFHLTIMWDKTAVSIPVQLTTEAQMAATITDVLDGPDEDDYYLAAQYQMEANKNLEQALSWIDKAIEMREEPGWWDYRIKTLILMKLGKDAAAQTVGIKGLELAEKRESNYGIREFKRILKQEK